jgi:peptidyl-prolyl cis-trans isomerase SurA
MKAKKLSSAWISKALESFVSEQLLDYENNHLEQKYSDFKNLMQEYRDGILLFNISNAQVWEKASKDSVGLAKYFEDHKSDYKWTEPRFRGRVISCRDKKTMSKIDKILKTQPEDSIDTRLAALNPKDSIIVKSEANLFAKGANAAVDYYIFKTGTFTPPAKYSFVKVSGKLLNAPETYFDVKGLVTQDYQTYLEKEWIASLQKKHQILVNEDVLKTIKH